MRREELLLPRLLEQAETRAPAREIATATPGGIHRQTYAELGDRTRRLASALWELGIRPGDRVATFAWNSWRHLELFFAVPCIGATLHPLNVRLHPDQVARIAERTGSRIAFVDEDLWLTFDAVARRLTELDHIVLMGSGDEGPPESLDYEKLLAGASPTFESPADLDEGLACTICFTSGTTGEPKGVAYSHRSTVLHAQMLAMANTLGLCASDVVMPVVPMFHAAAWGFPYAATLAGAAHVYAGRSGADPATLASLIESEGVTVAAGVPTVWIRLLRELERSPRDLSSLRLIKTGAAPVQPSLIETYERRHGVEVLQGWGMTETGTLASLARLGPEHEGLPAQERYRLRAGLGRAVPGIRIRVVDEAGADIEPHGKTAGEILVTGNWVASAYLDEPERTAEAFADGWLRSGDLATIDTDGFLRMVDRAKDLVKSGGEWISSIDLEAALMEHPGVHEAAVIAVPNDEWGERPLAFVALRPGAAASKDDLLAFMAPRFPRWWLPDEVLFLAEIPKTGVGKFDKRALRERFAT